MKFKLMIAASAAVLATACGSTEAPVEPVPTPTPTEAPETAQEAIARVAGSDRVYFGFDEDKLTPQAQQVLRAQAAFLKANPSLMVRIEGNCDERGTREYNLALGAKRANATKLFLMSEGIASSRITTISFGKDRPIDPRPGDAAWAKNRNSRTFITGGSLAS